MQQVTKRFGGHTVLKDLSLKSDAAVLGIAGSNGSGKSTLLRCLAGLIKAKGSIRWTIDGEVHKPDELTGRIGYAAPYVELYEGLTVTENLSFIRSLHREALPFSEADLSDLLERFQAAPLADKPYGDLSTGQRQRVKLAAACLWDPAILFLDEPGANLDDAGRLLIRELVEEFSRRERMVILASNQQEELELATEIVRLA